MSEVFDARGLTVTPANVLGLRTVIMTEAAELRAALDKFTRNFSGGMPILGGDPVSPYAKRGFDEATDAYLGRCQTRIDELNRLGEHLAAAARGYGRTEAEIEASFREGMRHDASPLLRAAQPPGGVLGSYLDPRRPGWPA